MTFFIIDTIMVLQKRNSFFVITDAMQGGNQNCIFTFELTAIWP